MIQQTSIDAYHTIKANGLLSKRRFEVYEMIAIHGPVTLNRIIELLAKPGQNTGSFSGRISELVRQDVIEADGVTRGPNGHTVTLWNITGREPRKLIRNPASPLTRLRMVRMVVDQMGDTECTCGADGHDGTWPSCFYHALQEAIAGQGRI